MQNLKERLAAQSLDQKDLINLKGGRGKVKSGGTGLTPTSSSPSSSTSSSQPTAGSIPVEYEQIINNYVII